jgi:hypothetical protein
MPSIFQSLALGASETGLTLTTSVYTGSTLSTTAAATESPASSGRYTFTFTSPAAAATYDWSMQDATGMEWGNGGFETDASGNQINESYVATTLSSVSTTTATIASAVAATNTTLGNGTYGLSALQTLVAALTTNAALATLAVPGTMEIPSSGSLVYPCLFVVRDEVGHLVDLSASPTIAVANAAGTSRAANLSAISHASTGVYAFTYTVQSSAVEEGLGWQGEGTAASDSTERFSAAASAVVAVDTATAIAGIASTLSTIATQTTALAAVAPAHQPTVNVDGTTNANLTKIAERTVNDPGAAVTVPTTISSYTGGAADADAANILAAAQAAQTAATDTQTRVNLAIPNAAPAAAGGLITVGSGSGQINPNGNGSVPTTGASGSGAYSLIVNVNDGANPIPGAMVRIGGPQSAGAIATNTAGNANFALNSGTITVTTTATGYAGSATVHTIDNSGRWDTTGSADLSISLSAAGASLSPGSAQTTAYLTTRDGQGDPIAGVTLTFALIDPQASADSYDLGTFTATSDNTGLLQVLLRQSSTYQARLATGPWTTFTTGSASSFPLPEILGNYAD